MDAEEVYGVLNRKIKNIQVSGGGVSEYKDLSGKPKINGTTLQGNLSTEDIGITIPERLPNPNPIKFDGILLNQTYDGSEEVSVTFPNVEILNETAGTPVGDIIAYMGNTAPKHYLKCDGSIYNISDYPYLAEHINDEFGSYNYFGGDGETTFAVPDLRGEFLRGTGTAERDTGSGASVGVHQNGTEIPNYDGTIINNGQSFVRAFMSSTNNNMWSQLLNYDSIKVKAYGAIQTSATKNNDAWIKDGSYPATYTSRPTNTAVLYCIKYEPTYYMKLQEVNYSYDERRIGTWVDGKPLYEKTVNFGSLPNATVKEVPHEIENVDTIWVESGYVSNTHNQKIFPLILASPVCIEANWVTYATPDNIGIETGMDRTYSNAIVTLRYTKTTDS